MAVSTAAASLIYSGNANAAQELVSLAEGDNRIGVIASLFVPALAWVGFNMLQPILNQAGLEAHMLNDLSDMSNTLHGFLQLDKMTEKKDSAKRSITAAIGLGAAASLLLAENADAATEVAQLAASDNRVGVIATLFVPALGWVGFNMLQPAKNQV
jgi:photosystem II PsbY protein